MIGHEPNVIVNQVQHWSGFTLFQTKKPIFQDRCFTILLVYRSHKESIASFFNVLTLILSQNSQVDFIFGDFNINALKDSKENKDLKKILVDFKQLFDHPSHIDGGLIDHIYVKNNLLNNFKIDSLKICVNISDHDALKIRIQTIEDDDEDTFDQVT